MSGSPTVACTICSKNYLPFARVLMRSMARVHPDWHRVVLLLDEPDGYVDPTDEDFEIVSYRELGLPKPRQFLFRYSILEANTAVKPWLIRWALSQGYERAIYLDPDILVISRFKELEAAFDQGANLVLTPHLTAPIEDDRYPSELDILKAGTWNLGFLAVQRSAETERFAHWFSSRLEERCVVDVANGLFVDQKWMDLAPSLFSGVQSLRHEGYNVAYWNLPHRLIQTSGDKYLANDVPLRFFHFSGFNPVHPRRFSKHQNRYTLRKLPSALRKLTADYRLMVLEEGYSDCFGWPYAFDTFSDGAKIPNCVRSHYRRNPVLRTLLGDDPFAAPSTLLNQDWQGYAGVPKNSFVMQSLWEWQADVQRVFPDPDGADRTRFAQWYAAKGVDYGIPQQYSAVDRVCEVMKSPARAPSVRIAAFKDRILSAGKRLERRIRLWRKRRRGKAETPVLPMKAPNGCNAFGYYGCEMGVGEAARCGVRALRSVINMVSLLDTSDICGLEQRDDTFRPEITNHAPYNTNLFFVNADQIGQVQDVFANVGWRGGYNIGFWHWELSEFPDVFNSSFDRVDEVWVASQFVQQAISEKANCAVFNAGLPVNPVPSSPCRKSLGLPEKKFLFLSCCDLHSFSARKNPFGAVTAFQRAFCGRGDVELVLKVSNHEADPSEFGRIQDAVDGCRNVRLMPGLIRRQEMVDLLAAVDCFVSLHRSEGFGLSLAESMALGKPVIGTGYSGNLDFMNHDNSCLVRYSLVPLDRDYGPYAQGQIWADPDLDHAAWWMRRLTEDAGLRKQIAKSGQRTIQAEFSDAAIGKRYHRRLGVVWSRSNDRAAA